MGRAFDRGMCWAWNERLKERRMASVVKMKIVSWCVHQKQWMRKRGDDDEANAMSREESRCEIGHHRLSSRSLPRRSFARNTEQITCEIFIESAVHFGRQSILLLQMDQRIISGSLLLTSHKLFNSRQFLFVFCGCSWWWYGVFWSYQKQGPVLSTRAEELVFIWTRPNIGLFGNRLELQRLNNFLGLVIVIAATSCTSCTLACIIAVHNCI